MKNQVCCDSESLGLKLIRGGHVTASSVPSPSCGESRSDLLAAESQKIRAFERFRRHSSAQDIIPDDGPGIHEGRPTIIPYRLAYVQQQRLVVPEVVLTDQILAQPFTRGKKMPQIAPAVASTAGRTPTCLVDGALIVRKSGILQFYGACPGECVPFSPIASGQDAVEHVDPALDRSDQIVGLAHAHEVARCILGQLRGREVYGFPSYWTVLSVVPQQRVYMQHPKRHLIIVLPGIKVLKEHIKNY